MEILLSCLIASLTMEIISSKVRLVEGSVPAISFEESPLTGMENSFTSDNWSRQCAYGVPNSKYMLSPGRIRDLRDRPVKQTC
jgi:hypothetical protein